MRDLGESAPVPVSPQALHAVIRLELLCEQQRRRRQVAVHLLALSSVPLQIHAPRLLGRFTPLAGPLWWTLAAMTALLLVLEWSARRQLARALLGSRR